jgi:hypothetical protein
MKTFLAFTILILALTACSLSNPPAATLPPSFYQTDTPLPTLGVAPTNTFPVVVLPTATSVTEQPTFVAATPISQATSAPPPSGGGGGTTTYLDDRSTPQELMRSFVNSINRHEYLRTYAYWETGAAGLASYNQFAQGYSDTQSVQLTVGTVHSEGAAGSIYYSVPVTLVATQTNGTIQTFVGCYALRQPQAQNFAAPPFRGMAIHSADVQNVANNADTAGLMANACPSAGGLPTVADIASPQSDITPANYVDDRSDGVQVLRSLFNSVNRQEYVRAYSYWEPGSPQVPGFNQFQQGYADTNSVQMTTGRETVEGTAGSFYHSVPVILVAQATGGTKTFSGCYVLRLADPSVQGQPPFQPLAIRSATIQQVPNSPSPAMPTCP